MAGSGTAEQAAEEPNIERAAPKGAMDWKDLRYR
jgi:hypothetical protein